jgi:signal transduction histidine kinase
MRRRWGLQARMTVSYVLVTAVAVLVVQVATLGFVLPRALAGSGDLSLPVQLTARDYVTAAAGTIGRTGRLPTAADIQLGEPDLGLSPGQALIGDDGSVRIPLVTRPQTEAAPMSLALLLDRELRVVATSYPARFPVGTTVARPLPVVVIDKASHEGAPTGGQVDTADGSVIWALAPIHTGPPPASKDQGKGGLGFDDSLGVVYVQAPATAELLAATGQPAGLSWAEVGNRLGVALLVLLAALPVGVVFGLLSTRGVVVRVRRLAASTVAVADGEYQRRVPVSGADEVSQLEDSFNRMAGRLADAMAAERQVASAAERARIARELHDSISQDLFSLRLLVGGLRKALPVGSPLHQQVDAMDRTATGTMQEMQALLLELRPVALQHTGLVPALADLCRAYRERLGVAVDADLEPVDAEPDVEHAVLRIVQEALANAVKHARADRIAVRLRGDRDSIAVTVTDDGAGFDAARAAERQGMGLPLMRERVAELGGTFQLDSDPSGTTVDVRLPRSRS